VQNRRQKTVQLALLDWLLLAVIVAFLGVGLFFALFVPPWSCRCLDLLDAHDWGRWTWSGVAMALAAVLAAMRCWPESREELEPVEQHRRTPLD
jgi:hypothetical protein